MAGTGKRILLACAVGASLFAAQPCLATTIIDPPGDILSTYAGQVGPDLDILQFTVTRDASNFYFQVLVAGALNTTLGARYTIGVNRGTGTNTFPAGFRDGALQDAALSFVPAPLGGEVRLLVGGITITPLPAGAVSTSGNTISATVPISMLPSTGFQFQDYTFLLWSRTTPAGVPNYLGVADFAPNQGLVSLVPEVSTWAMMLIGFGSLGVALPRRRKPTINGQIA